MTDTELQEKLDQLAAQTECYRRMSALNQTQAEALTGDAGRLAQFAADKALLMKQIERHEERLAPFKREWPNHRESLAGDWVERFEHQMGVLRGALEELIAGENEMLARFASRKQHLKGEMDKVKRARKVPSAYKQDTREGPRHFDERQ